MLLLVDKAAGWATAETQGGVMRRAARRFIDHVKTERGMSPATVRSFRDDLKKFIEYKGKALKNSVEPEAPLFAGRGGQHSPPITLMKSFKEAVKGSGVREVLSIHSARHTYATFLLRDSGNLRYVQKQLGHSNSRTTEVYADVMNPDLTKSLEKLYV